MDDELNIQEPHYIGVWQRVQAAFSDSTLNSAFQAALSGTAFGLDIDDGMSALDPLTRASIQRANQLTFDSLVAARKGDLNSATELLAGAEASFAPVPSENPGRDIGQSSFYAASAYVRYRQGRFGCAEDDLRHSNAADLRLFGCGMPFMHVHRIQLVHNLARIDLQRGRRGTAIRLMNRLVRHISGQDVSIVEFAGTWSRTETDRCDPDLLAAMLCQVLRDLRIWSQPQRLAHPDVAAL